MSDKIKTIASKAGFETSQINYNEVKFDKFAKLLLAEATEVMMKHDYHGEWLGDIVNHHFKLTDE